MKLLSRSAQSLEGMMQVLLMMLGSSTQRHNADVRETRAFEKKIRGVVESDGMQRLQEIRDADKSVDRVLAKDAELRNWTEQYDVEAVKWRRGVFKSLKDLTAEVDAEVATKAEEAKNFDAELYEQERKAQMKEEARLQAQAAKAERQMRKAKAHLGDTLGAADTQFTEDAAADAEEQKQVEFEIAARMKEAVEAEKAMNHARDQLRVIGNQTGTAGEAARNVLRILDTKQEQVENAQKQVKDRIDQLNYIASGVATSSLLEGRAPLQRAEQWVADGSWTEGRRLLAEHQRLTARAKELADELQELPPDFESSGPADHGLLPGSVMPLATPPSADLEMAVPSFAPIGMPG